jgi:hypothetical protein
MLKASGNSRRQQRNKAQMFAVGKERKRFGSCNWGNGNSFAEFEFMHWRREIGNGRGQL